MRGVEALETGVKVAGEADVDDDGGESGIGACGDGDVAEVVAGGDGVVGVGGLRAVDVAETVCKVEPVASRAQRAGGLRGADGAAGGTGNIEHY